MSAVTDEVVNPHSAMNTTTHVPQPSICENSRVPVNPTCSPAIKSELLCPSSHAVDVSGRSFPGSDRPCQNRGASEEVLRGAVQDATPIAFGEARVFNGSHESMGTVRRRPTKHSCTSSTSICHYVERQDLTQGIETQVHQKPVVPHMALKAKSRAAPSDKLDTVSQDSWSEEDMPWIPEVGSCRSNCP